MAEILPTPDSSPSAATGFEVLKRVNAHGAEYFSARDLQAMLGYNHWRNFEKAITKAVTSCEKSGNDPGHHFARAKRSPGAKVPCRKFLIFTSPASPVT